MPLEKAPDESVLVSKAIKGDTESFALLYGHYRPRIYYFLNVHLDDFALAEDLSQEVFLQAWRKIADYEDRGIAFSAWLYQIARNKMIDFFRAKQEMCSVDDPLAEIALPPMIMELEEGMDLAKQCRRVGQAIKTLSDHHQQVLQLRFIEELSIREVATTLSKTEGAVKLMQFRAVRELRQVFAFYCQSA
jgi:RNA polymerase sigma-70 factor (ECF subfamily)